MVSEDIATNNNRNNYLNKILNINIAETINKSLSKMSEEISDQLAIAEVSILYFNKIYDLKRVEQQSDTITMIAEDIEKIISAHNTDIIKAVVKRLSVVK